VTLFVLIGYVIEKYNVESAETILRVALLIPDNRCIPMSVVPGVILNIFCNSNYTSSIDVMV
jgi:hypothetical protein